MQSAERIVRLQQEEEQLEAHKDELLGQASILDQQVEHTVNSGRVVSSDEVRALVQTFLASEFPRIRMVRDPEEPCWTIDIDVTLAEYLRRSIETQRINNRVSPQLQNALGEHKRIAVTFDSDYARQRPNLEFITIRHPLAEAAREYWSARPKPGIPSSQLAMKGPTEEAGTGYFFIHMLDVSGAAQRILLEPVIMLDDGRMAPGSAERLLKELQQSADEIPSLADSQALFTTARNRSDACIALRRDEIQDEARRRNDALLAARSASLRASFDAKIRRTEEYLGEAAEERIRRMRAAQVANLRARLQVKLDDLDRQRNVVVSSKLIASGRVQIIPGEGT